MFCSVSLIYLGSRSLMLLYRSVESNNWLHSYINPLSRLSRSLTIRLLVMKRRIKLHSLELRAQYQNVDENPVFSLPGAGGGTGKVR